MLALHSAAMAAAQIDYGTPVGNLPPVGKWQSFLSYHSAIDAVSGDSASYVASPLGLIEIVPRESYNEYYFHNKVTGLSDMGIAALAYNRERNWLLIGYGNGNIDLMDARTNAVINLPAIVQNTNIIGSKAINHIYTRGNVAYFACDFGLAELHLDTREFGRTTFTQGAPTWSSTMLGEDIYMATAAGLFRGRGDGRNLQDFGQWERQGMAQGLQMDVYNARAVMATQGQLLASFSDTLFRWNASAELWEHISVFDEVNNRAQTACYTESYPMRRLSASYTGEVVYIMSENNVFYQLNLGTGNLYKNFFSDAGGIHNVASASNGALWIADASGAYRFDFAGLQRDIPNSPKSDRISSMAVDNLGVLWCSSAPLNYQDYFFDPTGFFRFDRQAWRSFDGQTNAELANFRDAITVAANPRRREVMIGSFMDGLVHLRGDSIVGVYNQSNTTNGLQGVVGDEQRTRVTGIAFDSENNCWLTNSLSARGIVVRLADGTWRNFESPYSGRLSDITVDRNGYKWVVQESGNLLVFDEGEIDTDGDERYYLHTTSNSELGSNVVLCATADLNGSVWVGTDNGLTIFSCGESLFDGQCRGSRPVVNPDNFLGRLLEGERVNDIAVDGANRKWVATNNGVFLLSEDGYERVYFFNSANSPLPDNRVSKVAVDGVTGMVYFATERGLVGYRGEATNGRAVADKNEAYAFPNPVRPDYEGNISITNLPTDANVKITDINGGLVHETYALGGQAVWNGYDYTGRRTASGVYLVWVVSGDGQQKLATKVVFLR